MTEGRATHNSLFTKKGSVQWLPACSLRTFLIDLKNVLLYEYL